MLEQKAIETPVKGKTYSLYGNTAGTAQYYALIEELADACLKVCPDIQELLDHVQKASGKKRFLKQQLKKSYDHSLISFIVYSARDILAPYTVECRAHLKEASVFKLTDSTLLTSEEQYHLYMLEIELINRINAQSFRSCDSKIAFLPHCLRDLNAKCRANQEPGDLDYTCKGCSKRCFINHVSTLLRAHDITPYIWMEADLKGLLKNSKSAGGRLGVLGIACIPELVDGIRLCKRFDIPVVGIPLNANRCARWMGQFHPTSVNLERLERLVGYQPRI